jgi:hypothetical protein
MTNLLRLYDTNRQLLSLQALDRPGFHHDACSMLAPATSGAEDGAVGHMVILRPLLTLESTQVPAYTTGLI